MNRLNPLFVAHTACLEINSSNRSAACAVVNKSLIAQPQNQLLQLRRSISRKLTHKTVSPISSLHAQKFVPIRIVFMFAGDFGKCCHCDLQKKSTPKGAA